MAQSKPARAADADGQGPDLTPDPALDGMKFEAALAELEQLVRSMEAGGLPLEESIAAYRRGSGLLKHCQQLLNDAERKIQMLEGGELRDFPGSEGAQ